VTTGATLSSQSQPSLSAQHGQVLEAGGIASDVMHERGYFTIAPADADTLAFFGHTPRIAEQAPVLMMPSYDTRGERSAVFARPDQPRLDMKGRPVKYETPRKASLRLDVHPRVRAALRDPTSALWITEGIKKADAAISCGAYALALAGVWNWKKHVLHDWDEVLLEDRTVYIAFDSDAATKPQVENARRRLKAFLGARKAHVRIVHLEPGPNGEKVGLDDALVAGVTLEQLAAMSTEHLRVARETPNDKRPLLDVTTLDRTVTLRALEILAETGEVYRTSAGLVRVERR
jgi:hypothetical protein